MTSRGSEGQRESDRDALILHAFARWQAAVHRYNAAPPLSNDDPGADDMTPAERAAWLEMEEAEATAIEAVAATPRGAAAQLRMALHHAVSDRADEAALLNGHLAPLVAKAADFDLRTRLTLAALVSLSAMPE